MRPAGPRRRRRPGGSRHLSLSATDADWAVVRRNADARGLSMARYLVDLVERGGADDAGAVVALSPDEQRELLAAVREIRALLRGDEVPAEPAPTAPVDGEPERLRCEVQMLEAARLCDDTAAAAGEAGGIALDAEGYGALIERFRALAAERRPGLPPELRDRVRMLLGRDARWRRDRGRVADFLGRAGGFARSRPDLEEDLRALGAPSDAAPAETGWREEANALLDEAKAIADGIAGPELAAHLKAAGAAPDAPGALAARIRAMLGGGPAEPAGDPRPVAPPGPR